MRTTLTVDDDLLDQARKRAAAQGVSLAAIINRALRRGLAEPDEPRVASPTVVYDPGTGRMSEEEWRRRLEDADQEDLRGQAGL